MRKDFKVCFRCEKVLELELFYKNWRMKDGRLGKCKECTKSDVRANYVLRREQYSEYDRARFQTPKRKVALAQYQIRSRERDPLKYIAHYTAKNGVRDGKISRKDCFYCGDPKTQAHHDDYSKPLDVRWVCFKCHREKEHGQVVSV